MRNTHLPLIALAVLLLLAMVSGLPARVPAPTTTTTCLHPGFTTSASFNINGPRSVLVDDFNNDGKPDVVAATSFSGSGQVSVFLGNGNGTVASPINSTAGRGITSLASADFNLDGKKDLLIGNGNDNGGEASVLLGNGLGGFGPQKQIFLLPGMTNTTTAVAAADMTGDNKPDLIILEYDTLGFSLVWILQGDGAGDFTFSSSTGTGGTSASAMGVTDLNADGKLDLVVVNSQAGTPNGTIATLLGDGTGNLGSPNIFQVGSSPSALIIDDFNSDGKKDAAVANQGSDDVTILFGNGLGGLVVSVTIPDVGDEPLSLARADFDGDGQIDLAVFCAIPGTATILRNDGTGSFFAVGNFFFSTPPLAADHIAATAGDLNADGHSDLIVVNQSRSKGWILVNECDTVPAQIRLMGDVSQFEGTFAIPPKNNSAIMLVTRVGDISGPASVDYNTTNGTAVAPFDYLSTSGTLAFAAGAVFKQVTIPLINDNITENAETLNFTLSNATGTSSLGSPATAEVTIFDDDAPPEILIDDVTITEGDVNTASADFSVSLSHPSDFPITVHYDTADGSATAGSDYQSKSGTLTFAPRQLIQTVSVLINGDTSPEPSESFVVNLSAPTNATITDDQGLGTILDDDSAPGPFVEFNATSINVDEGAGSVTFSVVRSGNTQAAVSVDYLANDPNPVLNCATTNGSASSRCDYLATVGTINFAPNETIKSLSIPIVDDAYVEGDETFAVTLSNLNGAVFGSPSALTIRILDNDSQLGANPIDAPAFYIGQHYRDFLNREPDQSGLDFWVSNFTDCNGDQQCLELKRINVSAAFFLSIEFQETGYLVERLYKVAYGDRIATSTFPNAHQLPVPIIRLDEFLPDSQEIRQGVVVGQGDWQQTLEQNKQMFSQEFVMRSRFTTAFPNSMTAAEFVDTLNTNAGNPLSTSTRDQLVNGLSGGQLTRAQVLRSIAEDAALNNAEFNRAFVLMQYFGYLRRNPDETPDSDYSGFDFWLTKLNQFGGNFVNADMVKAFIVSGEYRQRFGP